MPHVGNTEEAMISRIGWIRHTQSDTKGNPCFVLGPTPQFRRMRGIHRSRCNRMRSLLRFLDVKTDRTPLSPRLKSRPNRLAQLGMSRPNLIKAFLKNHVQGLAQTKKMMCRGGTIKILIEYFRIDPGQKIPVRGH